MDIFLYGFVVLLILVATECHTDVIYRAACVCMCVCVPTQSRLTLCDPVDCSPTRLLCPWDSPGKNTGVGCLGLLQRIFPIQKSMSPALAGGFFTTSTAWEAHVVKCYYALILEGKPVSDLPICGACSL